MHATYAERNLIAKSKFKPPHKFPFNPVQRKTLRKHFAVEELLQARSWDRARQEVLGDLEFGNLEGPGDLSLEHRQSNRVRSPKGGRETPTKPIHQVAALECKVSQVFGYIFNLTECPHHGSLKHRPTNNGRKDRLSFGPGGGVSGEVAGEKTPWGTPQLGKSMDLSFRHGCWWRKNCAM